MDAPPPPPVSSAIVYSTDQHPDSPRPPSATWKGILISGPASVVLGAKPPLVFVRGTYRIKGTDYPPKTRWKLVVIDPATNRPITAELGQKDPSPIAPDPEPPAPPDPATEARLTYVGHFNAELFLTSGLAPAAGTYIVRVELGLLKSNEIAIKVNPR